MRNIIVFVFLFSTLMSKAQTFEGTITDKSTGNPIENVEVKIVEDSLTAKTYTNANGFFSLTGTDSNQKTLTAEHVDYMFAELTEQSPGTGFTITLRKKIKSVASVRWDEYIAANDPTLDYEPQQGWSVSFKQSDLAGDFAPDNTIIRRDPSAVIQVNGTYYVYYSRALKDNANQFFPWDRCDIYYATSTDGHTWNEQGVAVARGTSGSFDDRSIFTPEVLEHEGMYYLVYQAVKDPYIERVKNTVGMSWATSPGGPWTKLAEPILHPTNNGIWKGTDDNRFSVYKKGDFDSHKVHDPTLVHFNGKFYLYYKGERMGEEQYFGQREIKWGVAIADDPLGPYEKSDHNPVTNTGHELVLWKYKNGIAIINTLDGPEREHILFAEDGLNFEIMSTAKDLPHAQGLFRSPVSDSDPLAGVNWGLSHVLKWDLPGGWMYINRFDIDRADVSSTMIPYDTAKVQLGKSRKIRAYVLPVNATETGLTWLSENESTVTVSASGEITGIEIGTAKVFATSLDGGFKDSVLVEVINDEVFNHELIVQAASFSSTGNPDGLGYGGPIGFNKSGTNINFVNRDDWGIYDLSIPHAGKYHVEYYVSTPTSPAQLSLYIGDERVDLESVYTNGQWDSYYRIPGKGYFELEKGAQQVKLVASGSNDWQWNMDQMRFYGEAVLNTIDVTKITIIAAKDSLLVGESQQLTVEVLPENASNKEVSWSSSNNQVATISSSGNIEALMAGETMIKAIAADNNLITDEFKLVVQDIPLAINSQFGKSIGLYPNPSTGVLHLDFGQEQPGHVWITSLNGKQQLIQMGSISGVTSIDISDYESGLYLLNIEFKEYSIQKKFILHNQHK